MEKESKDQHRRKDQRKRERDWLPSRLLNPKDLERDAKLFVYLVGSAFVIYWLTAERLRGAITPAWVEAFKWFLLSISIGGALWTAADRLNLKKGDKE